MSLARPATAGDDAIQILGTIGIIPVVIIDDAAQAFPLAEAHRRRDRGLRLASWPLGHSIGPVMSGGAGRGDLGASDEAGVDVDERAHADARGPLSVLMIYQALPPGLPGSNRRQP
jgi:hypothetical protein